MRQRHHRHYHQHQIFVVAPTCCMNNVRLSLKLLFTSKNKQQKQRKKLRKNYDLQKIPKFADVLRAP